MTAPTSDSFGFPTFDDTLPPGQLLPSLTAPPNRGGPTTSTSYVPHGMTGPGASLAGASLVSGTVSITERAVGIPVRAVSPGKRRADDESDSSTATQPSCMVSLTAHPDGDSLGSPLLASPIAPTMAVLAAPTAPSEKVIEGQCNLLVAGLTRDVDDRKLADMFRRFGDVRCATVTRHVGTGMSRGFGFVLFGTETEGQIAIDAMHGAHCGPNILNVRRSYHNGRVVESNTVFVRNIPLHASPADVAKLFERFGPIQSGSPSRDLSRGPADPAAQFQVATLELPSVEHARAAIEALHNKPYPAELLSDEPGRLTQRRPTLPHTSMDDIPFAGASAAAAPPPTADSHPPPVLLVKFAERLDDRRRRKLTKALESEKGSASASMTSFPGASGAASPIGFPMTPPPTMPQAQFFHAGGFPGGVPVVTSHQGAFSAPGVATFAQHGPAMPGGLGPRGLPPGYFPPGAQVTPLTLLQQQQLLMAQQQALLLSQPQLFGHAQLFGMPSPSPPGSASSSPGAGVAATPPPMMGLPPGVLPIPAAPGTIPSGYPIGAVPFAFPGMMPGFMGHR